MSNKELFEHYKKMISIRNSHPALQLGDYKTLLVDDKNEILRIEKGAQLTYLGPAKCIWQSNYP